MKTDISRNTFRRAKHYSAVRLKQNRLLTDADWNEQVDIQNYIRRTKLRDAYGLSGVPGTGGGFQIGATGVDLTISAGRIYVDGILCENISDSLYTEQIDLPGQTLPADGLYLAYLDVWERGVSRIEAKTNIRETALGGPDSGIRAQLLNQVKLLYIGDGSVDAGRFDTPPEYSALVQAVRGRMSARTRAADVGTDPCDIGERGGYSSQENRLYRVEIHSAGGVSGGAAPEPATFKWSRENATVTSELLEINGTSLTVRSAGRDRAISFRADDWLEIIDEGREKAGEAGTLARIQEIVGETLIVDPDSLRHFDGQAGDAKILSLSDFSRGVVRVRRWDMVGAIGAVTVPAAGTWLELENGIEVLFEDDRFRVGDAWLIPARAATRNVEWPRDSLGVPLPQAAGPEHRYAPLAYIRSLGGVWETRADLRTELSELTQPELVYISGDGQQGMPGEGLDTALGVRVASGPQGVAGAKVRFEIITGAGVLQDAPGGVDQGASFIVESDADGYARAGWRLDAVTEYQRVEAILLNPADDSDSQYLVRFNANLNLATAVEYAGDVPDPQGQNLLDGVSAVDEALDRLGEIKVNRAGDTIAGSLTVEQDFDVVGDLTVRGDVIVQDTNTMPGSVALGNNDADAIILHAELDSGHTSDRLVVDDTTHISQDMNVDGRIGIGTASPSQKLSATGIIEALEGGLVFPDGTLQTTAGASGGGVPTGYCIAGENQVAPDGFVEATRSLDAGREFTQWTPRANMPTARDAMAAAAANGRIYFIGGSVDGGGGYVVNEEYDPFTNTWRSRASLLPATSHARAESFNDLIFVFGGATFSGATLTGSTDATRVYDPRTNLWTNLAPMSLSRNSMMTALVDGRIHVIGGETRPSGGVYLTNHEVYDPREDRWSLAAPLPFARGRSVVAVIDGRIYIISGATAQSPTVVTDVTASYDPQSDSWATHAPIPIPRADMNSFVSGNEIHMIGGSDAATGYTDYDVYDPAADAWRSVAATPTARRGAAGAFVDGTFYLVSGETTADVAINEAYSPPSYFAVHCKTDIEAPPTAPLPFYLDWTARANLPAPRGDQMLVAYQENLYHFGGDQVIGSYVADADRYDPRTNVWTSLTAMPTARGGAGAAVFEDRIYVMAGNTAGSSTPTNVNEVYFPLEDRWQSATPSSVARKFAGAETLNGKIYLIGGSDATNLTLTEEYDPTTDSWTTRQPMNFARSVLGTAVVNGRIYAIGGQVGSGATSRVEEYDPIMDTWTEKASLQTARLGPAVAVVDNRIFVMGGDNAGDVAVVEVYDPQTDVWTVLSPLAVPRRSYRGAAIGRTIHLAGGFQSATSFDIHEAISIPAATTRYPLPAPRASHVMESVSGKLYLSGGYDTSESTYRTETYEYDPIVNTWNTRAAAPTARYEAMSGVVGDTLYMIGGGAGPSGATPLDANESFDVAANTWTARAAMPTARRDGAAASDGALIYVLGGYDSANLNINEVYDPVADSWSAAANMPTTRRSLSAVFVNGLLYAIGGILNSNSLTGANEVYDPGTDSWAPMSPSPIPRDKTAVIARNGRIYVLGGRISNLNSDVSTIVEEYDPATDSWRRMPDLRLPRGFSAAALIGDRAHFVGGRDDTQATSDHQLIIFEN